MFKFGSDPLLMCTEPLFSISIYCMGIACMFYPILHCSDHRKPRYRNSRANCPGQQELFSNSQVLVKCGAVRWVYCGMIQVQEQSVDNSKTMDRMLFGLTSEEVHRLAFQSAEGNILKHHFDENEKWLIEVRSIIYEKKITLP